MKWPAVILGGLLVLSVAARFGPSVAPQALATEAKSGQQIAATCASCHHPEGTAAGIPSLAGASEAAITSTLLAFKSGKRKGMIMESVGRSLSDADIAAVARYLAAQ